MTQALSLILFCICDWYLKKGCNDFLSRAILLYIHLMVPFEAEHGKLHLIKQAFY